MSRTRQDAIDAIDAGDTFMYHGPDGTRVLKTLADVPTQEEWDEDAAEMGLRTLGIGDLFTGTPTNAQHPVWHEETQKFQFEDAPTGGEGGYSGSGPLSSVLYNVSSAAVQDLFTQDVADKEMIPTQIILRKPSMSLATHIDSLEITESVGGQPLHTQVALGDFQSTAEARVLFLSISRAIPFGGKIQGSLAGGEPMEDPATLVVEVCGYLVDA